MSEGARRAMTAGGVNSLPPRTCFEKDVIAAERKTPTTEIRGPRAPYKKGNPLLVVIPPSLPGVYRK